MHNWGICQYETMVSILFYKKLVTITCGPDIFICIICYFYNCEVIHHREKIKRKEKTMVNLSLEGLGKNQVVARWVARIFAI